MSKEEKRINNPEEELRRSRLMLAEARLEAEWARVTAERVRKECQKEFDWWASVENLPLNECKREIIKHHNEIEEEEAKKYLLILSPFLGNI